MKKYNKLAVECWYEVNVNQEELDNKVRDLVRWLRDDNESPNEDGNYTAWGYEIVSGRHGQHAIPLVLREVGGYKAIPEDMEEKVDLFTKVCSELNIHLNRHKKGLPGMYFVSHHEADGSIGILYQEEA